MSFESPTLIFSSQDSHVYIMTRQGLFEDSPYNNDKEIIFQDLYPLIERIGFNSASRATKLYVEHTNNLYSLGVQSLSTQIGPVDFYVNQIISVENETYLGLLSPFIPGPQIDEIIYPHIAMYRYITISEKDVIEKFIALNEDILFLLPKIVGEVEKLLHAHSSIVALDVTNVKMRWSYELNRPILIITDIQSEIGKAIVF